ncbi:MAG TPA: metallophosphoesterase [Acidimicrobiia bacterium]|nr:metallophosphoesterase [Acidimicrobiia bacterium]
MGRTNWRDGFVPAVVLAAAVALAGLGGAGVGAVIRATAASAAADAPIFTAAGDIDGCAKGEDTANLVKKVAGPVATLGDNAYPSGSAGDYAKCYDPTWGAFKDRTHPSPGNHDYDANRATPYYQYFGAAAGQPGTGWYSYDVGTWHVVALNSNCDDVDCGKESNWLDSDLAAHPTACVLAYWHHPRFSSGNSGGSSATGAFWKVLYDHHASLVLNGHDHDYERFAPQNPSGKLDPNGIREIVVGTGGASLGSMGGAAPNSQVRNNNAYGVLEVTLRPDGYDWRFVPVGGDRFTDSGSDTCKGTAPAAPPTTMAPAAPPAEATPAPTTAPDPGPETWADPGPAGDAPAGDAPSGAPTAGDPPPPSRRRAAPPTSGAPKSPPPRGAASGAGSAAARPATSTTRAPASSTTLPAAVSPIAEVPPPAGPVVTSAPDGDAAGAVPGPGPGPEPPAALPAEDAAADARQLSLAVNGLIRPPAPHRHLPGPMVLAALGLVAVDAAGIAALRRRGFRLLGS